MKFIHIADLHLGAKPDAGNAYSQNREQELWDSFRDIITICNQKKTDLLLIAGDLFHRQPLLRELKEMNSILEMLEHTEVVMIAGSLKNWFLPAMQSEKESRSCQAQRAGNW